MLALQSMKDTTTGEDVFEEVKTAVEKVGLQWKRLSGISTDGAPAMVGSRSGAVVRIISYISDMDVNTDDVCVFTASCINKTYVQNHSSSSMS